MSSLYMILGICELDSNSNYTQYNALKLNYMGIA